MTKQVMELNKTIQDLKREVETIKKTQGEAMLEIENLGKKSGTIDVSISNRIQEMEERISGAEDSIKNIGTTIKENTKMHKDPNSKHPGNPGHNEKTKPTVNRNG
jgi:predicted  nucleic acid-binding Zn-ribbon protein